MTTPKNVGYTGYTPGRYNLRHPPRYTPNVTIPMTIINSPCHTPQQRNRQSLIITEVDQSTSVEKEHKVPQSVQDEVLRNSPKQPAEPVPQTVENSLDEFCKNAQALSNLAASMKKVITIKFMPGNKENQGIPQASADIEMTITDGNSHQACLPANEPSNSGESSNSINQSHHDQSNKRNKNREIGSPSKRRRRYSPKRDRGRYSPRRRTNRRYFSHRPCYCRDCIFKSRRSYEPRRTMRSSLRERLGDLNPLYRRYSTSTSLSTGQRAQQLVQGSQSWLESFSRNAQFLSDLASSINKIIDLVCQLIDFVVTENIALDGTPGLEYTTTVHVIVWTAVSKMDPSI
ncbi:hypothetical protein QAD02_004613 [Eretmocerus hayati]|uniref:Uncharacterized protein n=1 Tax=Eretmocerus hayati TaxID=131215 RepID=A0ACC2NR37_9HYME|nr:hypothetical protein QAD02_004613 [Eretmocerus hayati]